MLRLRTFGNPSFSENNRIKAHGPKKNLAVVVYLACSPNFCVNRETIAEMLWPAVPLDRSRKSLNQALYDLKQRLPDLVITREGNELALDPNSVSVDIWEVQKALEVDNAAACVRIVTAPFLEGFEVASDAFVHWCERWWTSFSTRLIVQAEQETERALARGDWSNVLNLTELILRVRPTHIEAAKANLEALIALDKVAVARSKLEEFRTRWWEWLDEELPTSISTICEKITDEALRRRSRSHQLMPFVGRGDEFEILTAAWNHVRGNEAACVVVSGKAGVGKSRLCYEFARKAAITGGRVLTATCYAVESMVPYAPITDLIVNNLRPDDYLSISDPWLSVLASYFPGIGMRGSMDPIDVAPDIVQQRFHEAVAQLLDSIARKRPICVLLDDAQWADESTLALMHYLQRRLNNAPVLSVLAVRPEEPTYSSNIVVNWGSDKTYGYVERIYLQELGETETKELVNRYQNRTGNAFPVTFADVVYSKSRGLPFFAAEILRSSEEDTGFDVHALGKNVVPNRVETFIDKRLTLIKDEAVRCLEALATVGGRADRELIKEVAGHKEVELAVGLDELRRVGFIDEVSSDVIELSHGIVRDGIYRMIGPALRRLLHQRAANALERRKVPPGRVVPHLDLAGNPRAAAKKALEAANDALAQNATSEGETFLRMALALAEGEQEQITIQEQLSSILMRQGHYHSVGSLLVSLGQYYESMHDENKIIINAAQLLKVRVAQGAKTPEQAIGELRIHLRQAQRIGATESALAVLITMGIWAHHGLSPKDAVEIARDLIEIKCPEVDPELRLTGMCLGLLLIGAFDNVNTAVDLIPKRLPDVEEVTDPTGKAIIYRCLGQLYLQYGDLKRADVHLKKFQGLHARLGMGPSWQGINNNLAVLKMEKGLHDEAIELLEANRQFALEYEKQDDLIFVYFNIAAIYFEQKKFAKVNVVAHTWVKLLNGLSITNRLHEPWSMMGLVALELGNYSEASRWEREIMLAERGRPLWYGDTSYREMFLSKVARVKGKEVEAVERLTKALKAYEERDYFCRTRIALELAKGLIAREPKKAVELAGKVREEGAAIGARPLVEQADDVLDRLGYRYNAG